MSPVVTSVLRYAENLAGIGVAVKRALNSFGVWDDLIPISFINIRNRFDKYNSDLNLLEQLSISPLKTVRKRRKYF